MAEPCSIIRNIFKIPQLHYLKLVIINRTISKRGSMSTRAFKAIILPTFFETVLRFVILSTILTCRFPRSTLSFYVSKYLTPKAHFREWDRRDYKNLCAPSPVFELEMEELMFYTLAPSKSKTKEGN